MADEKTQGHAAHPKSADETGQPSAISLELFEAEAQLLPRFKQQGNSPLPEGQRPRTTPHSMYPQHI